MRVIICQGIQGSGKSTWAKNWVAEDPTHRMRWNNDDVRNMLGPYWVPERESTGVLRAMRNQFIFKALANGWDIVIDDMNLNHKTLADIKDQIECFEQAHDEHVVLHLQQFFIPLEECIRRDAQRENPIGAKVITDTYNRYRDIIEPVLAHEGE